MFKRTQRLNGGFSPLGGQNGVQSAQIAMSKLLSAPVAGILISVFFVRRRAMKDSGQTQPQTLVTLYLRHYLQILVFRTSDWCDSSHPSGENHSLLQICYTTTSENWERSHARSLSDRLPTERGEGGRGSSPVVLKA